MLTNISVFWKRVPFGFRLWSLFLANSVPRLILLTFGTEFSKQNRIPKSEEDTFPEREEEDPLPEEVDTFPETETEGEDPEDPEDPFPETSEEDPFPETPST